MRIAESNGREETLAFFHLLAAGGEGLLELRPLAAGTFKPTGRLYVDLKHSTKPLTTFLHKQRLAHNYFAMALRRDASSGELTNCSTLGALYVDIDFKTTTEAEARRLLAECPVPPSIIIHSGGGLHVYWLLREPLNLQVPADCATAYSLLKRLCVYHHADPAVAEPAHILRVPNTLNFKYDPPRLVRIELMEAERRYNTSDFEVLPEPATVKANGPFVSPEKIRDGERNDTLYRLGRSLKAKGWSPEAIRAALHAENRAKCEPPCDDAGIERVFQSVFGQADRPEFRSLAERLARLRALSPIELSATWHTYLEGLNALDRQTLLKEAARLMNVGINTLKKAASEHRDEAKQAKINERVGPRLVILFSPEDVTVMAGLAERATLKLTTDFELINYGGVLSRVVVEPMPLAHQADSELPAVPTAQLDRLNRVKFLPLVERAIVVQADGENIGVPEKLLDSILQNPSQVPKVSALITHPLVTLKGRIVSDRGIDSATGLLLYGDRVNDLHPYAKAEAIAAVGEVGELLLEGFEFSTPFDRACAIGMMLTALQRRAIDTSPGFLPCAAQQGTGKTTLAKRIHHVLTGREMPVFSWPGEKDETETIKLLLATLLLSPAMICFDNVGDGLTFRSSAISAVMTGASLSGRILGESRNATVPTNTLFVATGNNVELGTDELQRWIQIRLTSQSISPHTRTFSHPDVLGYSLQIRERVLRHCIGIVAGYLQGVERIAPSSRFPQWDMMVRQPLLWAGLDDLGKAFELNIEASPELGAHQALVEALVAAFPDGKKFSAHDVIELYQFVISLHPLKEALLALHSKDPNSDHSVGHVLAKAVGRAAMVGKSTAFLRKQTVHGLTRYHVEVQKRGD